MPTTDAEIIASAKAQLRLMERQRGARLLLGGMGAMTLLAIGTFAKRFQDGLYAPEAPLLYDERFLTGLVLGICFSLATAVTIFLFLRPGPYMTGHHRTVLELLVRLWDAQNHQRRPPEA